MRLRYLMGALGVATVVLLGSARAADKWFVLSEQTIKATDPSVRITAEEGKWTKGGRQGDVKISVEGADVDIKEGHPPLVQLPGRNRNGVSES